jgi:hypothetical protein
MRHERQRIAMATLFALGIALASSGLCADDKGPPQTPAVKDFTKRVQDYLKTRQPLNKDVPSLKPTKTSENIVAHQRALAESLRAARKDAQQGDIFTPEIATEFRGLIAETMKGPEAPRIRKSLKHAEPVVLTLHVNDSYPAKVPLQSTPPTLLQNLPKLPKELDYRLIGRSLALRDCDANIIIDFIPNAIPIA